MKILVIGGHLTPALAFLAYLKHTQHEAVFVGRHTSSKEPGAKSYEEVEVTNLGFRFIAFNSPKLDRYHLISSVIGLTGMVPAYLEARAIIQREKPDTVLGFGGYLEIPLVIAAKQAQIPIVIHEQTAVAGLANQYAAKLASVTALSYGLSRRYFPINHQVIVGNLIRDEIFNTQTPLPIWASTLPHKPLIYVTGGNQGSININQALIALYPKLIKNYVIIHQTGQRQQAGSFEDCLKAVQALSSSDQANLVIKPWFSTIETAWIMQQAYLIISRAGANTMAEIIAVKAPSITIPLPKTHLKEQEVNARILSQAGAGITITNNELTPLTLEKAIEKITTNYHEYLEGFKILKQYINPYASRDLLAILNKLHHKS